MTLYRAEHNQELQGYFVEVSDPITEAQRSQHMWFTGELVSSVNNKQAGFAATVINGASLPKAFNVAVYEARRPCLIQQSGAGAGSTAGLALVGGGFNGGPSRTSGFDLVMTWGADVTSPNMRGFVGLTSNAAPLNLDWQTQTNLMGVGFNSAGNYRTITNDGAGAATVEDLGNAFPAQTAGACFLLYMKCAPLSSIVSWKLKRLDVPAEVTGFFDASNIPAATTFMWPIWNINNNTDAVAVSIAIMRADLWLPY